MPCSQDEVRIFWTAGLDSTFRVCWLTLVEGRTVQPIYIIDSDRKSWMVEIAKLRHISGLIRCHPNYIGLLKPIIIYFSSDFSPDEETLRLYSNVSKVVHIGEQYLWLAQFCKVQDYTSPNVELCMTKHDPGVTDLQRILFEDMESGVVTLKDSDAGRLFSKFSFPLLGTTKIDMWSYGDRYGFGEVLERTWFCHSPLLGKPCGVCRPCKIASSDRSRAATFSRLSPFLYFYKQFYERLLPWRLRVYFRRVFGS